MFLKLPYTRNYLAWYQGMLCGSNAFKGYFDDAKEFKNQEKNSIEVSSFKFSRIKNQE